MKFTDNYFMNYDIMAFTESFIDLDVPFTPDIADDKPVLEMTRFVKVTTFGLVIVKLALTTNGRLFLRKDLTENEFYLSDTVGGGFTRAELGCGLEVFDIPLLVGDDDEAGASVLGAVGVGDTSLETRHADVLEAQEQLSVTVQGLVADGAVAQVLDVVQTSWGDFNVVVAQTVTGITIVTRSVALFELLETRELEQSDSSIGRIFVVGQVFDQTSGPFLSVLESGSIGNTTIIQSDLKIIKVKAWASKLLSL